MSEHYDESDIAPSWQPPKSERTFRRSESIAALAAALAKAQGEMGFAKKDAANPYFKSKYADLASCWEAIREPLSKNGLAVMQFPRESGGGVEVETLLAHSSGEWVSESLRLPLAKADAQGFGSGISYARRYGLALVGVAADDDDGNVAARPRQVPQPEPHFPEAKTKLEAAAKNGLVALNECWATLTRDERAALAVDKDRLKKELGHA